MISIIFDKRDRYLSSMNRALLISSIFLMSLAPVSVAYPDGVGEIANDGCLCHGASNLETEVEILGLPESYTQSTEYNLTLTIDSNIVRVENYTNIGGFRLIVSAGEIIGAPQQIEEGYTHSNASELSWNLTWLSPLEDNGTTRFRFYGNAVNGNGEQTGDYWNSFEIRIPGVNHTGDVKQRPQADGGSSSQILTGTIGLGALLFVLIWAIKD